MVLVLLIILLAISIHTVVTQETSFVTDSEGKMAQEKRSLMKTGDFFKKLIVTGDALATVYGEDGIEIMDVYDFLLNDDSLDR